MKKYAGVYLPYILLYIVDETKRILYCKTCNTNQTFIISTKEAMYGTFVDQHRKCSIIVDEAG